MDVRDITAGRILLGRRLALAGMLALSAVSPLPGLAQAVYGRAGVTLPTINEHDVLTLLGNTPRAADPGRVIGGVPPETTLRRMVLVLKPDAAREQALEDFAEAQQQPNSPHFHHWLTPQEYGQRFGATDAELALATRWLQTHGFVVEPVNAGRRMIVFSGTEGAVEDAFHVALRRYAINGEMHIANGEDPQIPRALANLVAGVLSLNDFRHASQIAQQRPISLPTKIGAGYGSAGSGSGGTTRVPRLHPLYTQGTTHYLFPADFATIYDANPIYAQGISGAGSSIAIVGRSDVSVSDFSEFRSFANLSGGSTIAITLDGPDPGVVPGDQDEATFDIEWAGAVAPQAQIQYVEAASTATTDGVDLAAAYAVNHRIAPVISVSYASCESAMGATELAFYGDLWMQAASEGISVFVAAGDAGAAGCNAGDDTSGSARAVNGMCSPIWSTCVGGTEFNEGNYTFWNPYNGQGSESALGYIPEEVWNESGANGGSQLWASGGGVSTVYAQPPWQAGIAGANGNGMRTVPDVALSTALHDGYLGCVGGNWYVFSGTSVASPAFAGIMALVDQQQNGASQGSANPELYAMVNAPTSPFHTTLSGNNSVPGVTGFTASGTVYNLATGLGSVDATTLVENWAFNAEGLAASFSLTPSETAATVIDGGSTSFMLAATTTSGSTQSITLSATAPPGVTVNFTPASIVPGQSATVTVTAASDAPAGSGTIAITGTSGNSQQTVKIGLTVEPLPTLSVSATPSTLAITQGANAGTTVTVTTGGTFSGAVTLSTSGLPAGVTAVWSTTTLTPSANTTATTAVNLTLVAAANAPPVTGATVTVTAAGDGLSTSTRIAVTVVAAQTELAIASAAQTLTLVAGNTLAVPVIVTAANGFAGLVRVGVAGLPTGVTAAWSATQFEAQAPQTLHLTLTLHALATATPVSVPLSLTAFGDGQTAFGDATLNVTLPTALVLSLSANPLGLSPGATLTTTATVRIVGPLTLATNLTDAAVRFQGLPTGVSVSWGPWTQTANVLTAQGQVTAASSAALGTTQAEALAEITDTATGQIYHAVEPIQVEIHPAATLTVATGAGSLLLVPGATVQVPVTVLSSLLLSAPVQLSIFHLPAGVMAAWSVDSLAGAGGTTTLTLKVAGTVRPATGTLTIQAAGDGLSAQTAVDYRVY